MMNSNDMKPKLIELAEKIGLQPRLVASTESGEYHSSCPQCGGKNRFIIQPNRQAKNGVIGCYLCRQCGINGSSLGFCMRFLNMKRKEATCAVQSITTSQKATPGNSQGPSSLWINCASNYSTACHNNLLQSSSAEELIRTRGLKIETILKYRLGHSIQDEWVERESWGLPSALNDEGKPRKLWLSEGLVIPYLQDGVVTKLKVRRNRWCEGDRCPKYVVIPGSQSVPSLFGSPSLPVVIVEAELDGMLLYQEASDICAVLAIGGAANFPDSATHALLKKSPLILFALDFDEAGKKAFQRWRTTYPKLRAWPAPYAKSPGDAFMLGTNLRTWVMSGISKYQEIPNLPQYDLIAPSFTFPEVEQKSALTSPVPVSLPEKNDILKGIKIEYVDTKEKVEDALKKLLSSNRTFGLDIETYGLPECQGDKQAGLDPKKSLIRSVQIYDGVEDVFIFDIMKLNGLKRIGEAIWEHPMVAHNGMFEIKHLLHKGVVAKKLGCTLLADRVLNGDRRELKEEFGLSKAAGLKDLAKEFLGLDVSKELQTSDWAQEKLSDQQLHYAALDAVLPVKLFDLQWNKLEERGLVRAYRLLRNVQYPIAMMELAGIGFDVAKHKRLILSWQNEKETLEAIILEMIGKPLNISSSKQLGEWLNEILNQRDLESWERTGKGQLSTSTPTFKLHEDMHDLFPKIIAYRHTAKRISSFGEGLYKFIDIATNRLYGSFSLGTTSTGRMASYSPNMQNMPRDEFRSLFCAREGYRLIGLDYSQQELRVAALITQDKELLRIYEEGGDVHVNTAAAILQVPKEQVGKAQRQLAKAVIFGLLYGQGAKGLAIYAKRQYGVDMIEQEAIKHREGLFQVYQGLRKWQINTGRNVERSKKVRTPCGRERDFSRERLGYRYTAALNLPIQGAAAEITLHALIRLSPILCQDCHLVNVIHDEILLEVREDMIEEFSLKAMTAMEQAFLDVFPNATPYIRGLVEAKAGKNWEETK